MGDSWSASKWPSHWNDFLRNSIRVAYFIQLSSRLPYSTGSYLNWFTPMDLLGPSKTDRSNRKERIRIEPKAIRLNIHFSTGNTRTVRTRSPAETPSKVHYRNALWLSYSPSDRWVIQKLIWMIFASMPLDVSTRMPNPTQTTQQWTWIRATTTTTTTTATISIEIILGT